MARISKYRFDEKVTKDDFVIGSDGSTKVTRNYKLDDIAKFLGTHESVLGSRFAYSYVSTDNVLTLLAGELSFNNGNDGNLNFDSIENIYLNTKNSFDVDIYQYLDSIKQNQGVLHLYNGYSPVYFGFYSLNSINLLQNDVIELTVSLSVGNGLIKPGQPVIIQGNYSTGDKEYEHTQSVSSDVWNINHNLNKYPSVTIKDSAGSIVVGEISYVDKNNITVTFSAGFSGSAYLN